MRLGGPVYGSFGSADEWAAAVRAKGYRAAYCPVKLDAPDDEVAAYARAAEGADIVIAEVGAWSNPLIPDTAERAAALDKCKAALALADRIGARCCVNISGSRGEPWDGPHPDNLTPETFDRVVESVREIIDAVRPTRTAYTLEPMPWMYPDSADSYERLIAAINRPTFAVHFDPVNLIVSPQHYYGAAAMVRDFVARLGPHIRAVHVKDIVLHPKLTVHLDEVRPGLGGFPLADLLRTLNGLHVDLPVLVEHLPNAEEYDLAAAHLRTVAAEAGIPL
jgi:sugar phosphate isomerase/epimerase